VSARDEREADHPDVLNAARVYAGAVVWAAGVLGVDVQDIDVRFERDAMSASIGAYACLDGYRVARRNPGRIVLCVKADES